MKTQDPIDLDPAEWGLSPSAVALLSQEPEIVANLARDRVLPPLPPGYVPAVIEVLFDDIPYLRTEQGIMTYWRDCHPDYQPAFIEYRFDDEIAVFQIGGEFVVNRVEGIAETTVLQEFLA